MRNKPLVFKFIISVIILSFMLTSSCTKIASNIDINTNYNNDKIQLWYYIHEKGSNGFDYNFNTNLLKIISSIKVYCNTKDIPLEIHEYNDKKLSFNDYILKRNLAAASGNMITIEKIENIHDLSDHHADYSKINNYEKLLSGNKDRFCIPLGLYTSAGYIDNRAMQYYGIKPERKIITYSEYLNFRQEMKEKGARFELNPDEFIYIKEYYRNMNGLLFLNGQSEIIKDTELFKNRLKKTIFDICNDLLLYYDDNDLGHT